MGKPSSSLKKKRSKKSSQVHKQKRSKGGSRKNKSKKLRHRDDSRSSDDDTSRSSMSLSSSSSEDDYRSRRHRSRARKDLKSSKKRARRSSPKHGSIEARPRAKKRKGSKMNDDLDARKKTHKKKSRRDIIDSSMSSDSLSCSTCQGGSSSSSEREFERPRGSSERKGRDKRKLGKVKHFNERSTNRSRSCSSCSRCSESSGYQSAERWDAENNSRRLRSVITIVREPEEEDGRELDKDALKEEIVYDHDDDYPSSRSNDSNDGGGKRELTYHSDERNQSESRREAFVADIATIEDKETGNDCGTQNEGSTPSFHLVEGSKSEASGEIGDLELILRQRALENLRKFRGGIQTNAKTKHLTAAVQQSSTSKDKLVQIKDSMVDGTRAVSASQLVQQSDTATVGGECTYSSRNLVKIPDGKYDKNEPRASEKRVNCPPEKLALTCAPKENDNGSTMSLKTFGNKSKPRTLVMRREAIVTTSTSPKQASTSQKSHISNLLGTGPSVNTNPDATAQAETQSSKDNGGQVSNTSGPSASNPPPELKRLAGEQSSKEGQGEANEGSQFEKKTMSVMRGGEMVQVSYKVYIPKKAPASGWRHLQR